MSDAIYKHLDDVQVIDDTLAPGVEPWSPGDCFIVVGREMLYMSIRCRVHPEQLTDDHLIIPRDTIVDGEGRPIRPRTQTIRRGTLGTLDVRFDWHHNHGRLTVVAADGDLQGVNQISLDFWARRQPRGRS